MCLTIKKGSRKLIAKKDITVYKLVEKFNDGYRTVYQKEPVKIGETYKSKLEKSRVINSVYIGLHSMADFDGADYISSLGVNRLIVECVIPKGSKYYSGTFCGRDSFASDTITYIKIIE